MFEVNPLWISGTSFLHFQKGDVEIKQKEPLSLNDYFLRYLRWKQKYPVQFKTRITVAFLNIPT